MDIIQPSNYKVKVFILIIIYIICLACIPIQRAPNIKDYKIVNAKKFSKNMAPQTAFVFKDPKDANHFYNYLNTKFQLNHNDVGYNSPIDINGQQLFLTYYEEEKLNTNLNLPLILIDAKLNQENITTVFEENYTTRTGEWFLLITVYDEDLNNCLKKSHPLQPEVLSFLRTLKEEYLNTHNYESLLFLKTNSN